MKLYPAIDIKDGHCVRLKQGKFDDVTVYSDSPADMAQHWESLGASFLHLVDLDGACAGQSVNKEAVRKIVKTISIPVELGGGIRTLEDIREILELGVYRAIIGSRAAKEPEFVKEAVERFGAEHIVAGIDAKDGIVAINGWLESGTVTAMELAMKMKEFGVKTIVYTDISRDGMLTGPNIFQTKKLSDETGLDIVASGGVSSIEDLYAVAEAGIHGAIIGKALYENKIDLRQAVNAFERK